MEDRIDQAIELLNEEIRQMNNWASSEQNKSKRGRLNRRAHKLETIVNALINLPGADRCDPFAMMG